MDFIPASSSSGASIGTATPIVDGTATAGVSTTASADDHVHPTDTSRSALASPTFTGTPAAPTAAQGTNTTQVATTAMVHSEAVLLAPLASPTFTGTVTFPANARAGNRDIFLLQGSNTNIKYTYDRRAAPSATIAAISTGVMHSTAIVLEAGQVVTSISFRTGTTGVTLGSNADSHWWFALYDNSATPQLLSQTADQTTTTWGPSVVKTVALSTNGGAQTIGTTGVYYLSVMIAIGTGGSPAVPTMTGVSAFTGTANGFAGTQSILAQTSGSSLTTTAPSTIASATTNTSLCLAQVS